MRILRNRTGLKGKKETGRKLLYIACVLFYILYWKGSFPPRHISVVLYNSYVLLCPHRAIIREKGGEESSGINEKEVWRGIVPAVQYKAVWRVYNK